MATTQSHGLAVTVTTLNTTPERLQRARELYESGAVHPIFGKAGLFAVVNGGGNTYLCDTGRGLCTCPDHTHRQVTCKHLLACYLHGAPEEPVEKPQEAAPAAKPVNGKAPVAAKAEAAVYLQPHNDEDPFS